MPFAQLPDVKIHYEWAGLEQAPVLILSNSLGTIYRMWDAQLSELSQYFRLLRYDTRGHGESSVPPGVYSIDDFGRDVIRLADSLGIQQFYFCGLSMGGATGMYLGAHISHRIPKMVLCNTSAKFGTPEAWNARIETVRKEGMKAVIPGVLERWFTAAFRAAHADEVAPVQSMLEAMDPAAYTTLCAAVRDFDQRGMLGSVKTPTLVIAGTHDTSAPPADGRFVADHIPGAKYLELDAAHLSNIEARADFNKQVMSFLRG